MLHVNHGVVPVLAFVLAELRAATTRQEQLPLLVDVVSLADRALLVGHLRLDLRDLHIRVSGLEGLREGVVEVADHLLPAALALGAGVEVLLDWSCVVASRTPLRSAFEASLATRYVLANDTKRRALCYVAGDLYERLRWYEEHDPDTQRGKQFKAEMGLDDNSDFPMPDLKEVRKLRRLAEIDAG